MLSDSSGGLLPLDDPLQIAPVSERCSAVQEQRDFIVLHDVDVHVLPLALQFVCVSVYNFLSVLQLCGLFG